MGFNANMLKFYIENTTYFTVNVRSSFCLLINDEKFGHFGNKNDISAEKLLI